MDCQCEVWDEFAAGYEEEDGYDTIIITMLANALRVIVDVLTYVIRLSSIQHSPSVQPVVTSARRLCQSSSNPALRWRPATMVVKTIRIKATA